MSVWYRREYFLCTLYRVLNVFGFKRIFVNVIIYITVRVYMQFEIVITECIMMTHICIRSGGNNFSVCDFQFTEVV